MKYLLLLLLFAAFFSTAYAENDFVETEVIFYNDSIKLAGTLSVPNGDGPFPGVVLITGSGPENRDEEVFGFKIFKIIAEHLANNGIAVLRYDDRGVAKSEGDHSKATSEDFADDAIAAFKFLEVQENIDNEKCGLLGHSEGGIIATLAYKKLRGIDFIIFMASTAISGDKIINYQVESLNKAAGKTEEEISEIIAVQNMLYEAIRNGSDLSELEEALIEITLKQIEKMTDEEKSFITDPVQYAKYQARITLFKVKNDWFKYFITYDPAPDIESISCPVLILFAGKDMQVPVSLNKDPMEAALMKDGVRNFDTFIFPDANHLFQKADTGMYDEYAKLPKEFVDGFLVTISQWILHIDEE
jgi:alpha-beta hydrolase superfamily lysophospholipase